MHSWLKHKSPGESVGISICIIRSLVKATQVVSWVGGHFDILLSERYRDKIDLEAHNNDDATALHLAAAFGRERMVQKLLDAGVDFNGRGDSLRTPLHYASAKGHSSVIKILVEGGADINAKDDSG